MGEHLQGKHMCKLCNKSFPCGRSLGGHMKSHVIYPNDQEKLQKAKKVYSSVDAGEVSYGLRENPKKACRFKDSSEDTLLHDKLCKECGKGFQSWKALFGHMKCHSDKMTHTRVDEQDSWTSADQSDNGKVNPKKKRSERTKRCYKMEISTTTATSSSISYIANASSSVSEIEQEQEEVALCLIMLSKDVSHCSGLQIVNKSSVSYSDEFVDAQSFTKFEAKELVHNGGEILKLKNRINENLRDGPEMMKSEIQVGGLMFNEKLKKSKVVEKLEFQVSEVQMEKNLVNGSNSDRKTNSDTKKINSSKRKVVDALEPEMGVKDTEMLQKNCDTRSKFDCASCNKSFNSFQALGGHRASFKKMKGCFGLKTDGCGNNSPVADDNLPPNPAGNNIRPHEIAAGSSNGVKTTNKVGSHKCPICFRVFLSGQALGGHKRSHLIADPKSNQTFPSSSITIQKHVPEIRDFLDLNLPAPDEEDTSTELNFNKWWIESNHKHENLLDLLSS